jgi:hypothetical protein
LSLRARTVSQSVSQSVSPSITCLRRKAGRGGAELRTCFIRP